MGFWHTGYLEHHEITGLGDYSPKLLPPTFTCKDCGKICLSVDELSKHRFENHPSHRPTFFIRGKELGTESIRITRPLAEEDLDIDCDRAFINGQKFSVDAVSQIIVRASTDVCRVKLYKGNISEEFELNFCIASEQDIRGIEMQFNKMIYGQRLDGRVVDSFINATEEFGSAIGYCDGICSYLYGVMAKERCSDSGLPHEKYVDKYNEAAKKMMDYERPLAMAIRSVIGFHFNHFSETSLLTDKGNVGRAASVYADWMKASAPRIDNGPDVHYDNIENAVMDFHTQRIVCWVLRFADKIWECVTEIEAFLKHDIEQYDNVKARILLSEIYSSIGDSENSILHARSLRNIPNPVGEWANAMIEEKSEAIDE